MRFYIRLIAALGLMGWGHFVFADDFYWQISYSQLVHNRYDSPSAACSALQGMPEHAGTTIDVQPTADPTVFECNLFYDRPIGNHIARRFGSSCASGAIYNSETGECEAPPKNECEEKAGDSTPFSKTGDIGDGFFSISPDGKYGATPSDSCIGGCTVAVQAGCKHRISANKYWCTGYAYFSGTSCAASPGAPQVEAEENYRSEEPNTIEKKEPCNYTTDAEGRSVCVSKASLEKEGQNCGEYNGQTLCVPKTATSDEKTVETEVTESTEPDGSKTTVKKDTATVTKCTGSNKNCTTTTTTTTTTSKSDGSGATTSTTVECKGKDCGSGTGGGGAGNGSGSGEGEEGEEGGELEGQDEVAGFGESLQDFNTRISAAPILSTVTSIAMPRGGSCSMPSANIPVIGSISFNWICDNADLLDPLYYVMLAIWALFATRVFLEA